MSTTTLYRGEKYLIPTVALLLLFGIIPVLWVLYQSLFFWQVFAISGKQFVGLANYSELVNSPQYMGALARTLLFVGLSLAVQLPLGLGFALLLDREFRGRGVMRTLLVVPLTIPPISVGANFLLFTREGLGIVPTLLNAVGLSFSIGNNAAHAWIAMIAMDAWHWTPLITLIFLAGLTSIPPSQIESAKIDGANAWEIFRHIKLPHLKTVGLVALLIRLMDLFRAYDSIWMLTGGGPGTSTTVLNIEIVRTVIQGSNYGFGSALSLFALYIIIMLSWLVVNVLHEEVLSE